ncbi:proline dehydrogenase [Entomortierella parvispora]|uniref:Proline dehydrogenase n=1 Tax=Entomortierella parvispora TaxID=205924 RepID=A0A9P3HC00_9FUNG|nr:proline dehydrogenase [Entomortierella parvispora]
MASRVLVRSVGTSASPLSRSISSHCYTPLKPFVPHSRGHTRLSPPSTRPPPSSFSSSAFARSYSSASPAAVKSSSVWSKVAVGSTIALATSATLLSQLAKAPQMEANSSALSPLTGGNVIQDLQDENNRIAVEKKSTLELLRSIMVYKMCTFSLLVDLAPQLIHLAELVHLTAPAYWIVRKTFFAQFCGGETADDCIGTMNQLKNAGIGSILDLSIEVDLDESDLDQQTPEEIRSRFNKSADNIAQQISTCIETASNMSKSFAAIKVTAMGSPLLLQQVSTTLTALESGFKNIDQDRDGKVTKEEFKELVKMLPSPVDNQQSLDAVVDHLFKEADKDQDGRIDWVDFACTVSMNRDETRALFASDSSKDAPIPGLESADLEDYKRLLTRMEKLCDQAEKTNTRLMIDAEQSYFQPAIDSVALHLQEHYNHTPHADGPLIYNTYQMYLKDALGRLQQDYTRAQRNGYILAAKLVRGAYMVSERKRATELGLEDPICDGIEATHTSYNAGVDFMLGEMTRKQKLIALEHKPEDSASLSLKTSPVVLFVASHNKDSVMRTCERMQDLGLSPQSGLVMFGQLMGMCDQISYTLGQHGYGIYKYVPYGPIHHVIPYLIRRAQENASVLGGVTVERNLLWAELKSRFMAQKERAQIQAVPIVPAGPATTM